MWNLGKQTCAKQKRRQPIQGIIPSKIEWNLTNGPHSVSCDRAIRSSGFFGVRSVGPVGDFLEFVLGVVAAGPTYLGVLLEFPLTKDTPLNGEFRGGVLRVVLHVKLRFQISELLPSLTLTANAPENRSTPKCRNVLVFQPSIFRCELAVSFREGNTIFLEAWLKVQRG